MPRDWRGEIRAGGAAQKRAMIIYLPALTGASALEAGPAIRGRDRSRIYDCIELKCIAIARASGGAVGLVEKLIFRGLGFAEGLWCLESVGSDECVHGKGL